MNNYSTDSVVPQIANTILTKEIKAGVIEHFDFKL